MPKKRFNPRYSKPASTPPSSLVSAATSSRYTSASKNHDVQPTVNELIYSLRRSSLRPNQIPSTSFNISTLPPDLRYLLSQPETSAPKPRSGACGLLDANGRLTPAGPAPPQSWITDSTVDSSSDYNIDVERRIPPSDLDYLPGLTQIDRNSLKGLCLRTIAKEWTFLQEYEQYNLAFLPTCLRISLLSHIALYGPEIGVGFQGLKHILMLPQIENDEDKTINTNDQNQSFFRLDLSKAIGRSLSFKQLSELVNSQTQLIDWETSNLSWEDNLAISISLSPPLPYLTHLSLSHPSPNISWPRLISFMRHLPNLTHLSLAHWPIPSRVVTSSAVVTDGTTDGLSTRPSHSIGYHTQLTDCNFNYAAVLLRKLASRLPALEYLDLTGCQNWFEVLVGYDNENFNRGIQWGKQWSRLHTIRLQSGLQKNCSSNRWQSLQRSSAHDTAITIQIRITSLLRNAKLNGMKVTWIDFVKDD